MVDKEIQNIDFSGSNFGNSHERAVIPSTSSYGTFVNSVGTYSNSHHSRIRRSSDDREKDLLLEAEHERQSQPLHFDEFSFSNPQEVHVDRLEISGERVEVPSSSGPVSVPDESMTACSKRSSPHRIQRNINNNSGFENNPHRSSYSDSHEGYLASRSGAGYGATSGPVFSSTEDTDDWIFVELTETLPSLHCPPARRQEAGSNVKDFSASGKKDTKLGLDVFPST